MTPRMDLMTALERVHACGSARVWLVEERIRRPDATSARERWEACPRGDWLLWLAARAGIDRRVVVRAACAVARTALVHVPAGEMRPLRCIEVTEAWCDGRATLDEVRRADAAAAAAAYAAYAADAAAYAAAYAAVYAAAAAYAAAYADAAAYAGYAAAYASYAAASPESLARSAEIVRGIIPWRDVERGLYLAAGGVL